VLLAPNVYGTSSSQDHDRPLLLLQVAFSAAHVSPTLLSLHPNPAPRKGSDSTPTLVVGLTADADVLLRAIESGR